MEQITNQELQNNPTISDRLRSCLGNLGARLTAFVNPSAEQIDEKQIQRIQKRWAEHGRRGFIVVPSAESGPVDRSIIARLRPTADDHEE